MTFSDSNLPALLHSLDPQLHTGEFVFCTFDPQNLPSDAHPLMTFQEQEGMTLILDLPQAERLGIPHSEPFAWITLMVHSPLSAVGLTTAVSTALAEQGIACNMVAAYHHDHCFVPVQQADRALEVLGGLQK